MRAGRSNRRPGRSHCASPHPMPRGPNRCPMQLAVSELMKCAWVCRCDVLGKTRKTTSPNTVANVTGVTHARTIAPAPPVDVTSAASINDPRCNSAAVTATAGNATITGSNSVTSPANAAPTDNITTTIAHPSAASRRVCKARQCATWTTRSNVASAAAFEFVSNVFTRPSTSTAPSMMSTSAVA